MMTKEQFFDRAEKAMRGSADDLRAKGLTVAVHNDYRLDGKRFTFWLFTVEVNGASLAFKGEGESDAEALDRVRGAYANATDDHKHAPMCPANHYHGQRPPTGECSCGAVVAGVKMKR